IIDQENPGLVATIIMGPEISLVSPRRHESRYLVDCWIDYAATGLPLAEYRSMILTGCPFGNEQKYQPYGQCLPYPHGAKIRINSTQKHFPYLCAYNCHTQMEIHQFYDEGLAHASYVLRDAGQIALIDPARNPEQYLNFAERHGAVITAVIETHPHAD